MKKALKTICITLALAIGIFPICFGMVAINSAKATPLSNKYLLSPILVSQNQNETFVFDEATSEIKVIKNGQIVLTQTQTTTPNGLICTNGHLFILENSDISCYLFTAAENENPATLTQIPLETKDNDQPSGTDYVFSNNFAAFSIVQEEDAVFSVFVQSKTGNNIEIHKYILTYFNEQNCYTVEYNNTVYSSTSLSGGSADPENRLQKFAATKTTNGYNFLASDGTALYSIVENLGVLSSSKLQDAQITSITAYNNGFAYATTEQVITTDQAFEQQTQSNYSIISLAANAQTLVGISANDPVVKIILPVAEEGETLFENDFTQPEPNHTQHKFGTTLVPLTLLEFPYSVTGVSVAANQDVTILAEDPNEFEGLLYVTYAAGEENLYGYLPAEQIEIKQATAQNYDAITTSECKMYTLPSNIIDSTNVVITTLSKGEEIRILHNAAEIIINNQKYFYVEAENGKFGYVEAVKTARSIINPTPTKIHANATINQNTALYETKSQSTPLLSLAKGSRIKIKGLLNPTTKYTQITFEDQNGEIHNGYVLTKTITSDNVTTLQVVGIVLLVLNFIVLMLIVSFYIANKRKQQKQQ